jgi:hypothetical protein
MPAISTTGVSVGAYALANKFAPRFKGAVVIGGLLGAVVQAITAAASSPASVQAATAGKPGLLSQIVSAFTGQPALPSSAPIPSAAPPAPAAPAAPSLPPAGTGEYTRIGGRSYAEGGMFREIGEYTTVGDAYSAGRPRPGAGDNQQQWALDGADDASEFAPGEGGVLSGGLFR